MPLILSAFLVIAYPFLPHLSISSCSSFLLLYIIRQNGKQCVLCNYPSL